MYSAAAGEKVPRLQAEDRKNVAQGGAVAKAATAASRST